MNLENRQPPGLVGAIDQHLAIEAPGPKQGGVQNLRSIGGRQQNDAGTGIKAIEFGQQLVECLFLFVLAAQDTGCPAATKCIQLVDKDDASRSLSCLLKQVPDPCGADADKQLDKFRARNREEGNTGFTGHCACE